MRSFSGSGGAAYLLGDPVANGDSEWRPTSLVASLRAWRMVNHEVVATGDTQSGLTLQTRPGALELALDPEEFTDVVMATGDELLVTMPFMTGEIHATIDVTEDVAATRWDGPLQFIDPKEVIYVP